MAEPEHVEILEVKRFTRWRIGSRDFQISLPRGHYPWQCKR